MIEIGESETLSSSSSVQRKWIPLNSQDLAIEAGVKFNANSASNRREKQLTVVASLIDKTSNLGGLCRTCEIFGVTTLVLGNLRVLQDSQFQSLSVSSEKWLNIVEVQEPHLPAYIRECKANQFTVVALEQTTNSCPLGNFSFPEKTLLLLGNEKYGLPVEILCYADECVEIEQTGVTRSLNVHVSASLAIYSYTNQWKKFDLQASNV